MAITDPLEIQIFVKQDVTSADLARAVIIGDQKIQTLTGTKIADWNITDAAYGQLKLIGSLFGAWNILMGWDPKMYLDKAREIWKSYEFEVKQFRELHLPESRTNPEIDFGVSEYTYYKLNPNYKPFMSVY